MKVFMMSDSDWYVNDPDIFDGETDPKKVEATIREEVMLEHPNATDLNVIVSIDNYGWPQWQISFDDPSMRPAHPYLVTKVIE